MVTTTDIDPIAWLACLQVLFFFFLGGGGVFNLSSLLNGSLL